MTEIHSFTIDIPQEDLDDPRDRLTDPLQAGALAFDVYGAAGNDWGGVAAQLLGYAAPNHLLGKRAVLQRRGSAVGTSVPRSGDGRLPLDQIPWTLQD